MDRSIQAFPSEGAGPGMTLRDWFAGQAVIGFTNVPLGNTPEAAAKEIGRACYLLADAMLEARK